MTNFVDLNGIYVIAPNFKQRLSGVTSTIIQLIPKQNELGMPIAVCGAGLPRHLRHIRLSQLWRLWQKPTGGDGRIWHARRNIEMLPGIIMRDVLHMKLKLVFTSASQRDHTRYTKWLISKMDAVIATSQKTANYLKVTNSVILHGIDLERFKPCADKPAQKNSLKLDPNIKFIGCFGRIRHQKGTDLFVDSMIDILPRHPGWSALVAGRATERHVSFLNELKDKVNQAGLADRILFIGEHQDIERYYQALDLYIAPQRWEGFGLTPLEAAGCGVPTIATDVGAFSELIIEGKTGHIVTPDNLGQMISKTEQLLLSGQQLTKMSKASRTHMEAAFSLEKEARAINQIYRELLQ